MRILKNLLAALALTFAAQPAYATPPDVIDIREEPFGVSDTHLFVTRTSTDNLGLHESLRSESHLVRIDLETGDETSWVLDRVTQFRDYDDEGDQLDFVTRRDEGLKPVNPYAILAEHDAIPWDGAVRAHWITPEIVVGEDSISVSYGADTDYRITLDEVARAQSNLVDFMARTVADHRRMSTMSTRQMFAERQLPMAYCKPDEVLDYFSFGRGWGKLIRINCTSGEEDGLTSFVVQLKAVDVSDISE